MSKKRKSTPTTSNLETSPPITETPSETMDQSSSSGVVQNSHEFIEENLKGGLLDWLKEQTLYLSRTPSEQGKQETVVGDLAEGLITVMKETPESSDMDAALLEEIKKHTRKLPMDPKQKLDRDFMEELPIQILDHVKDLRLLQDISDRDDPKSEKNTPNIKKKATVVLLDDIAKWIEKLPIETDDLEETRKIKEQIENKLVHKIGELNMNSEIFNDDFLYDDILGDHVENLLVDLPGQDIKSQLHVLKRELLGLVKKARKKIREENLGQKYKHQLYETISKTLPSLNLSVEGKASFEVLKDEVADAFINMRYVSDGEEVRKLKKKIDDEIYTFCNKYLKRCPASPVDTSKLNEALYKALKNITEPENESFADDVELVKLKEVINDWTKQLPLKNQFGQEKLHTNKMVWILSKKVHDIETGKDFASTEESENNKKKEIEKFLTKLPLTTENEDDINEFVANIMTILKDTEESRKRDSFGHIQPMVTRASKAKLRISFNDVSVSPRSTDTFIQITNRCPEPSSCLVQKCSSVQTPCKTMQAKGSQANVMPQVIVNEHVWDSIEESCSETPRTLCPCPTLVRPPYSVMPQPLQSLASTQGDETWTRPPSPSCPGSNRSRPVYESTPSSSQNPLERRGSESNQTSLKGCLTSRPYPLEPFQNRFKKPRDPAQFNPCCCGQSQSRELEPRSLPNYGYENYHSQLSENPAASRNEQGSYQAEKRCSNQSFVSVVDENTFQRANQNFSSNQLPRVPSSSPPQPFQLSTHPSLEPTSQYETNLQNDQYPKQPCSCSGPGPNGVQQNQYISCPRSRLPELQLGQLSSPYSGWQFSVPGSLLQCPRQPLHPGQPSQLPGQPPQYPGQPPQCPVQPPQRPGQASQCPGRPTQFLGPPPTCPGQESRRLRSPSVMNPPHQEDHSANQCPFMSHPSPHCHRGQPYMVPLDIHTSPQNPSHRMPCAFNPRSPCYLRPPSVPCDEYEPLGPFRKSATRIGTLDDDDQSCRPRFNDWNKVREDLEYWEGDRPNCISRAIHRRERRCKMCRHRHGECNGRRF